MIAEAIRASEIPCDAINLLLADGEVAGQEAFRSHLRVIPQLSGAGFEFKYAEPSFEFTGCPALNEVAEKIKQLEDGALAHLKKCGYPLKEG